jgi:sarcosine oxidase
MRRETVVVGGGAMGSATAWHLARRGREVTLLERFGERHAMGASHGRTRNFNVAYHDPTYQSMVQEAAGLWRELEDESGATLLDLVGQTNHGAGVAPDADGALRALGVTASMLGVEEAQERWRGIRYDTRVLHLPEAGRVYAEEAVVALQRRAAAHGADVRLETPVVELRRRPDERVDVVTGDTTYVADTVVVTAGGWTSRLLGELVALPRLVVTQEQPAHFAVADPDAEWPSYMHLPAAGHARYEQWYSLVYGGLTPGEGVKAGWHAVGPVTDPDARTFEPDPVQLAALRRYVGEWLPGVDPDSCTPMTCTYTSTPDDDFVLDRAGPIVVGAGFSGHGFKFVPTVGRILADLVERPGAAPAAFGLDRPSLIRGREEA